MKMPSREEMRTEFHRISADLVEAHATLKPKQEAYDKKHAELSAREQKELKPLADDLKATRDGLDLHGLQTQLAMLSRALGGETGAPPSDGTSDVISESDVGKLAN